MPLQLLQLYEFSFYYLNIEFLLKPFCLLWADLQPESDLMAWVVARRLAHGQNRAGCHLFSSVAAAVMPKGAAETASSPKPAPELPGTYSIVHHQGLADQKMCRSKDSNEVFAVFRVGPRQYKCTPVNLHFFWSHSLADTSNCNEWSRAMCWRWRRSKSWM